jgi:energy-coupling factor transporter ATP-binding protein EcfA2
MAAVESLRIFNDDPVEGTPSSPDLLGRRAYAEHAVDMLRRVREQSDSGVLALVGAWGSGKSSVLQMITGSLRASDGDGWRIAELNPWLYPDLNSLAAALFTEIRQALPDDKRWSIARERIAAFGKAVSPVGALAGLAGVNVESAIKGIAEAIGGDSSATAAKRKVEEALREVDQPVLVVMDDLDRLTPAELLLVFKLVRLVGHLPNVHYLLSYDERTLRDVLSRSELVGGKAARAGEFLEKIVQVRLDLPAFRDKDAVALIDYYLTVVLKAHQRELSSTDVSRLQEAFFGHLQVRLTTPRSVKRFFAQVDAGLQSVAAEVDIVDYLLMTFLRTMEPGVFSIIKRHRAELAGDAVSPTPKPADVTAKWRERVVAAEVAGEHVDGVLELLAIMFRPIGEASGTWTSSAWANADQRRGVGSADYFDRYVVFSVPDDDLSEAAFDAALQQIATQTPGPEFDGFVARLRDDTHRIVRRLRSRHDTLPAPQLLLLLAQEVGNLKAPAEAYGLFQADRAVAHLAIALFPAVLEGDRRDTLERMADSPHGAILAVQVIDRAVRPPDAPPQWTLGTAPDLEQWASDSRDALAGRFARHLDGSPSQPGQPLSDLQRDLLQIWSFLAPEQTRAWVHEQVSAGVWDLTRLLVDVSPIGIDLPGRITVDLPLLDRIAGLDYIRSELANEIAAAAGPLPSDAANSERLLNALHRHQGNA